MSFISDFDAIVDYPGLKPAELGLLVYFFRNQGESFIFYRTNILKKFCIKKDAYYTALNGLRDKNLITYDQLNEGKFGGLRITINMSVILAESGKTVSGKSESGKSAHGETVHGKSECGKTVSGKSGHINGVNIEGSKSIKGVNGVREGDSVPAAPCDTIPAPEIPAGTQTSLLPPDIPPAPVPEPRKRFTPPTVADVSQYISERLREKNISWSPYQISETAESIVDFYTSKGWKVGKDTMKNWRSSVSGWLRNDNWMPKFGQQPQTLPPSQSPVNQQRQPPKSFKQQDLDYANRRFNDPVGEAIRAAVDACLGMGGDDPCEYGLPEQYREQAIKLLQEERKRLSQSFNPFPAIPM